MKNDGDIKRRILNNKSLTELLDYFETNKIDDIAYLNDYNFYLIIGNPIIIDKILQGIPRFMWYSKNNNYFKQLLERLSPEEFLMFMSKETVDIIKKMSYSEQNNFLQYLSRCTNRNVILNIEKTELLDILFDFDYTSFYMGMTKEFAQVFFENIIQKKRLSLLNNFAKLNDDVQLYILMHVTKNDIDFEYQGSLSSKKLVHLIDSNLLSELIKNESYYHKFVKLPIEDIVRCLFDGLILQNYMAYDSMLVKKLSTIDNPNIYRYLIIQLQQQGLNNIFQADYEAYLQYCEEHNTGDEDIKRIVQEQISSKNRTSFNTLYIEQIRKMYYDNIVSNLASNYYLTPEYYSIKVGFFKIDKSWLLNHAETKWHEKIETDMLTEEDIDLILEELSTSRLLEIMVDRFFEDITYNFLINLNSLLDFYESYDIDSINFEDEQHKQQFFERLEIYKKIKDFYNLTHEQQLELYNSFDKSINYTALFYDDFSLAKNLMYEKMNEYAFTPSKRKDLYNAELSQKYGVDIYVANGEDFYAYLHVSRVKKEEWESFKWGNPIELFMENPYRSSVEVTHASSERGASISLISSENITPFRSPKDYIAIGFNYLIPKYIKHVSSKDSFTFNNETDCVNELATPENLMARTKRYSEISYLEYCVAVFDDEFRKRFQPLIIGYFICYDEISEYDILLAQKEKLSILLVKTEKYRLVKNDYDYFQCDRVRYCGCRKFEEIKSYEKLLGQSHKKHIVK